MEVMNPGTVLGLMPSMWVFQVATCEAEYSRKGEITESHMLNRMTYLGDGCERVFCLLCLIETKLGLHWFAYLTAPEYGEAGDYLIPLTEWSPERQLNACEYRAKILELVPDVRESTDREGYIFTGPVFTIPAKTS